MKTFFLLFCGVIVSCNHLYAQRYDDGKITVRGEADIKVVPDQEIIALSVQTVDPDIDKSRSENDVKVRSLLSFINQLGVEKKDVQTDYINIEPKYEYRTNEQKFVGYAVTKNITVILRDLTKGDTLITGALKSGVNYLQSVDFKVSNSRKWEDEARLQAIRAAKEKATALASELGQKIRKPLTINEDRITEYTARGNRNLTKSNYAGSYSDGSTSEGSTIAPGQIDMKAQVTVTFEMDDR